MIPWMWKFWDAKKIYSVYTDFQKKMKNLVIRSKENWVVVDFNWESKVQDIKIEDENLLKPENKEALENAVKVAFEKWQDKAKEVAIQKFKEVSDKYWIDLSQLDSVMWMLKQ